MNDSPRTTSAYGQRSQKSRRPPPKTVTSTGPAQPHHEAGGIGGTKRSRRLGAGPASGPPALASDRAKSEALIASHRRSVSGAAAPFPTPRAGSAPTRGGGPRPRARPRARGPPTPQA